LTKKLCCYYCSLLSSDHCRIKSLDSSTNGAIKGDVVLVKADTTTDLDKYKGKLAGKIIIYDAASLPERAIKAEWHVITDDELANYG